MLEVAELWVVEGLAVEVVVPPPLIQPLATTLRAKTATNNRPNNVFFMITTHSNLGWFSIILSDIYILRSPEPRGTP